MPPRRHGADGVDERGICEAGGRWIGHEVFCKGASTLKAWQVSQDWCPAYGDLQRGESAEELISDVRESDSLRNRLHRVWAKVC
jgi:hypothetical protein